MSTDGTFAALVKQGRLIEFEKDADDHRQPERCLYFKPETKQWIDELPHEKDAYLAAELPPHRARGSLHLDAQAFRVLDRFVYDAEFFRGDIPRIKPQSLGVYEIKTDSLRIFGAFHCPHVFICAAADYKRVLKGHGDLVAAHRKAVVDFVRSLPLPEPKIDLRDVNELLGKTPIVLR